MCTPAYISDTPLKPIPMASDSTSPATADLKYPTPSNTLTTYISQLHLTIAALEYDLTQSHAVSGFKRATAITYIVSLLIFCPFLYARFQYEGGAVLAVFAFGVLGVFTPWLGELCYKASQSNRWIVRHSPMIVILTVFSVVDIGLAVWAYFVRGVPGEFVVFYTWLYLLLQGAMWVRYIYAGVLDAGEEFEMPVEE
ncbi:hypothetical protein K440DRAFT_659224 [Wilcoxina mikolae CBS 423.85]|nr:hypothetical protein K440DRAFT_659224 [Wilcoxina mikolae CBS 423.85]